MRAAILVSTALLAVSLHAAVPVCAASFTLDDRVRAQEAIERVYYSHQTGTIQSFEQAVPHALLERKVLTYLGQSAALEQLWKTPVTEPMLEAELRRMEQQTRMPERLRELYRALGNDPETIRECLARPALVQRLSRDFFDFDQRIHAEARRRAEQTRARLAAGWVDATKPADGRFLMRYISRKTGDEASAAARDEVKGLRDAPGSLMLDPDDFAARKDNMAGWSEGISPVEEDRDAFLVRVLLKQEAGEIFLAIYREPKTTWEAWWKEIGPTLDARSVQPAGAVASDVFENSGAPAGSVAAQRRDQNDHTYPTLDGAFAAELSPDAACGPDNSWSGINSPGQAPEPRYRATSVWTGSLVLVWGGIGDYKVDTGGYYTFNSGGRYDPATDTWTPMSLLAAPLARYFHTAVWTGSRMIVWGGIGSNAVALSSGGVYDPVADTWNVTSTMGSPPSARYNHTAVWSGTEMIIWGGDSGGQTLIQGGSRYNPTTDSWTVTSLVNAPPGRYGHVAVWTGSRMIIWGGVVQGPTSISGGRYDPITDSWQSVSTVNAPEGRSAFTAVWTGSRMVVWGGSGSSSSYLSTGGQYDPVGDSWSATSTINAPAGRNSHAAVWTGTSMLVWGGDSGPPYPAGYPTIGGRYDPATNSWTLMSAVNAPSGRSLPTAIWTGSLMVVWGGSSITVLNTGGRYNPASDSWTPTSGAEAPSPRTYHTALWTGNLLLIWGGIYGTPVQTGARFDPATAQWSPTTLTGAPDARYQHTAVWTGSVMIVWGGRDTSVSFNSGGRYNPISDSWSPTSLGPLSARYLPSAVWTGSRMIVWGGNTPAGPPTATGARYNPAADAWEAMSAVNAPSPRGGPVAVWTGGQMVIWGGNAASATNTGGLYDPAGDSWTPTSLVNAPEARRNSTAVWTGSAMIVWGGYNAVSAPLQTGGRFDPVTNSWSPTSLTAAPVARANHSAVWTGSLMLIWGGLVVGTNTTDTGGRYEPVSDTWTPMPAAGAPSPRSDHTATWLGDRMLVWGGASDSGPRLPTLGGLYCTCANNSVFYRDNDADGFGDVAGWTHACSLPAGYAANHSDCNDAASSSWATPGEALNLAFVDDHTMSWDPPAALGGTSVFYDAIRSDNPASFNAPALCILDAGGSPSVVDTMQPAAGAVFNYLVRARNNCPTPGTLGNRSDGTARTGVVCP